MVWGSQLDPTKGFQFLEKLGLLIWSRIFSQFSTLTEVLPNPDWRKRILFSGRERPLSAILVANRDQFVLVFFCASSCSAHRALALLLVILLCSSPGPTRGQVSTENFPATAAENFASDYTELLYQEIGWFKSLSLLETLIQLCQEGQDLRFSLLETLYLHCSCRACGCQKKLSFKRKEVARSSVKKNVNNILLC